MLRYVKSWMVLPLIVMALTVGWENTTQSPTGVEFGKIYLRDNLLLVNELTKGIRFLDITNPSAIVDLGLLSIEENNDMALTANDFGSQVILYADSRQHLVVYNVTDPRNPYVVDTVFNIFQRSYDIGWGRPWIPTVTPTVSRHGGFLGCGEDTYVTSVGVEPYFVDDGVYTMDQSSNGRSGRGGSMARFAVVDNYLYCIDYNELYVFDVSAPAAPRFVNRVYVGWGIETLYPYKEYLFIGGQNGMYLYSRANPKKPDFVSEYQHLRACDPVVVEGSTAYVTLRGGTRCGTVVSALHLIDMTDLKQPKLITSYSLPQPTGLDVSDKVAYVCDDSSGVFILNTTDPKNIVELSRISGTRGYDAILNTWMLIVTSRSNIALYNVSNPYTPTLVGKYGS